MNTKTKGSVEVFIFQEKDGDFCAVCLNLNLIEWGKDPEELTHSIKEAVESYVNGVISKNLSDDLLNRPAPEKYWKKARKNVNLMVSIPKEEVKSDYFKFINRPYSHGSFITA